MDNDDKDQIFQILIGLFVFCIFIFVCFGGMKNSFRDGYKEGQIDALNGTVKYELMEHRDGTKNWERKKEDTTK